MVKEPNARCLSFSRSALPLSSLQDASLSPAHNAQIKSHLGTVGPTAETISIEQKIKGVATATGLLGRLDQLGHHRMPSKDNGRFQTT